MVYTVLHTQILRLSFVLAHSLESTSLDETRRCQGDWRDGLYHAQWRYALPGLMASGELDGGGWENIRGQG